MAKQKTRRAATKRLKMSATGKVMRTQAGKKHLNLTKSRKRKRNLRGLKTVSKSFQSTTSRMLSTYK